MGNKEDHAVFGLFFAFAVSLIFLGLIIYIPDIIIFFRLDQKPWLMFIGFLFYYFGIFLPDADHHNSHLGKIVNKFTKTRHRGHWHSITAALIYGFITFLVTLGLSLIFGFQLTIWLIINPILFGYSGYMNHLSCDVLFDWYNASKKGERPKKTLNPIKLW